MDKFLNVATKIASNRYLSAIKDAFIMILPLTMASSFAVLIDNVLLATNLPWMLGNPDYWGPDFIAGVNNFKYIFNSISSGTLNIISFLVVGGLAYILSRTHKTTVKNPYANALIIFGVFFSMLPYGPLLEASPISSVSGATNLFTALIVGILFTELLLWLQSIEAIRIKLPEQVPPAVADAFSSMIPAIILFIISGTIALFFKVVQPLGHEHFSAFVAAVFQAPFLALAQTNIGGWGIMFIFAFFANFLWIFGLHGTNVLAGFSAPTIGVLQTNNTALFDQFGDAYANNLSVFTSGFYTVYAVPGGGGGTLALLVDIFFFSKRDDYKAIAKLATLPGVFQINEPVTFGLPVVLNPILAIPFVLVPMVSIILPGILTTIGWLPKVVIGVPWVTPPILNAFLATGGSFKAALIAIINFGIGVAIYIPFVLLANKEVESEVVE